MFKIIRLFGEPRNDAPDEGKARLLKHVDDLRAYIESGEVKGIVVGVTTTDPDSCNIMTGYCGVDFGDIATVLAHMQIDLTHYSMQSTYELYRLED